LWAAAGLCTVVVATLALMVGTRWDPLQDVDTGLGTPAEAWSFRHVAAVRLLVGIEIAFGTVGTIVYVLALVVALWLTHRRRAMYWTLAVMVGTSVTTTLLKLLFHRSRPQWKDPVHALTSFSFPSGHASGIASGMGVVVVLTALYVYSRRARQVTLSVAAGLVVLVGADRILLGVHNLSDVLAGYAVAGFWLFTMLAVYPPQGGGSSGVSAPPDGGQAPVTRGW
jgi:membrane-associated phospholipid phosphatase